MGDLTMTTSELTEAAAPNSGYERLESQIAWYDKRSLSNQKWFKRLKLIEIVAAAGVPVTASYSPVVTGVLGMIVLVVEGAQHLNQHHRNWISYRTTCEALRHEKCLFLAGAAHYMDTDEQSATRLLAERVESLVSTEHAKWLLTQKKDRKRTNHGR